MQGHFFEDSESGLFLDVKNAKLLYYHIVC